MIDTERAITNIAAYKFVTLDRLSQRRKRLYLSCRDLGIKGTILLSEEGINLFLAGAAVSIETLLRELRREPPLADLEVKFSYSNRIPFSRLLVKVKKEIITFDIAGIRPEVATVPKLAPKMLKEWLDAKRAVTLLDVRNDYEFELGAFDNSVAIGVDHFRQFPAQVAALPDSLKQQPIVMYCTGGIRCEKAGPFMQQAGFQQVYQLDGGILKYFEECGGDHYHGECFVFDQRVALDSSLRETATVMCFACQAPLTPDEQTSPQYVMGKSCPRCYQTPDETLQHTLARRHARLLELTTPLPGSQPYENRRPIGVPGRCDQWSLIELLVHQHPFVDESQWQAAISAGRLQRDGRPLSADQQVRTGDRIENVIPQTTEPDVNARIEILYEDAMIVVLNKPAPLPMHPCGRYNRNTVIAILNEVYRPQRLRVAHRLDANTTGVVVLSRSGPVAGILQPQFERGDVQKLYRVKVHGHPAADEFECRAGIAELAGRLGTRTIDEDGLASWTTFRVLRREPDGTSLLEAAPKTGRTNQIRLHLAHLGWPVVGDPLYGCKDSDAERMPTLSLNDAPLCLHAWQLQFRHPHSGQTVIFTARAPDWCPADLT